MLGVITVTCLKRETRDIKKDTCLQKFRKSAMLNKKEPVRGPGGVMGYHSRLPRSRPGFNSRLRHGSASHQTVSGTASAADAHSLARMINPPTAD